MPVSNRTTSFFYREMSVLGLSRSIRAAILVNPQDASHQFPETVARNAGYVVKLFREEEAVFAAYDWKSDLGDEEIVEKLLSLNLTRV